MKKLLYVIIVAAALAMLVEVCDQPVSVAVGTYTIIGVVPGTAPTLREPARVEVTTKEVTITSGTIARVHRVITAVKDSEVIDGTLFWRVRIICNDGVSVEVLVPGSTATSRMHNAFGKVLYTITIATPQGEGTFVATRETH